MPRIRTVKPEFWDDEKLAKLSRDQRLLYIGLWNFADDIGVISGNPLWIKSRIFPYDQIQVQQFEGWMNDLVKHGFISQFSYNAEDFYYLPNLTRHQVISRPNYKSLKVPIDALIKIIEPLDINVDSLKEINSSSNIHGAFNDQSYEERKGKEGNRKGREGKGEFSPATTFDSAMETADEICNRLKLHGSAFSWSVINGVKARRDIHSEDEVWELLDCFKAEQIAKGGPGKLFDPTDFREHFINWVKKPDNGKTATKANRVYQS